MAQDTTEHPNTLTLRIDAAADYVIDWLRTQTKHAPAVDILRSENGVLKVATGEQRDPWPVENVIQVQVHPLADDRCEVIVRHPWPDYAGWPATMLERMAKSYPECRPAIDRHLALIRAASSAGDLGKIESPAGIPTWPTEDDDPRLLQIETEGDRPIVARWNRQNPEATAKQIGKALTLAEGTVYNRIGIVKQDHPELVRPRRIAKRVSTK